MARISTYVKDTGLTDKDLLVGSNYVSGTVGQEVYETTNFTLDAVKSYIGATGGDSTFLKETTITLTPTQILSLNGGGSIELIAAPGAGKIIVPISYASFLDFNTTAYNVSINAVNLTYKDASLPNGERFAWINSIYANADLYVIGSPAIDSGLGIFSVAENQALVLKTNPGVPITGGDSPLKINILYRIIDFS